LNKKYIYSSIEEGHRFIYYINYCNGSKWILLPCILTKRRG
jgi:hypothetical protein